jgi:hypothetical protein
VPIASTALLERKYVQAMALDDRGENDAMELKRVNDYNSSDSVHHRRRSENRDLLEKL